MSDPVITTTALTKVFKDFWNRTKVPALTNLDLTVRRGEVFGLLGPNGSGKSTTMKLLLGLLHPTKGSVSVLGKSPRHVATRRRIGYLPEASQLYQQLSASETLHFYGGLFGLKGETLQTRTRELLDMVGLAHAAQRPVGEFSKGMARRIGLAQALINDPDLVILDEPTRGIDVGAKAEVYEIVRELTQKGRTVILVSSELPELLALSDRILVMREGELTAGFHPEKTTQEEILKYAIPA